jgi:hypothetical protein
MDLADEVIRSQAPCVAIVVIFGFPLKIKEEMC